MVLLFLLHPLRPLENMNLDCPSYCQSTLTLYSGKLGNKGRKDWTDLIYNSIFSIGV